MSGVFALNASVSKQQYSFPKLDRFKVTKKDTNISCYNQPTMFNKPKESGVGKAFGSTTRFNYYENKARPMKAKSPSPSEYQIKGQFGKDVEGGTSNGPNKEFSFGVSRTEMKKLHIDLINDTGKKDKLKPGPGSYNPIRTFGNLGMHKTFSKRLGYDTISLKR